MNPVANDTIYLVVDDDAVRDSLKLLLESLGFSVRDFANAADLLRQAGEARGSCLILDLHLPIVGALDLLRMMRMMRQKQIEMPVILISGRADVGVKARALEVGAVACLDKPIAEAALIGTIQAARRPACSTAA